MRLLILAVLIVAVAASTRDPNLGETILQPSGLQIVNGGGSIMAPSANQFSNCNTCAQFNNCPSSCGQVVTQVTVAQPVAVATNCQSCVALNNCPVSCGYVQQAPADPTRLTVTPVQSVSPTILGNYACGCLSQPVCACRGTILLEEKEAEEKKTEEKCGCVSQPVCGCRATTYVAPELSNSCGCSVCPCSSVQTILTTTTSSCGCSVCPCVSQYVQPEIVDPVPCGCIALGPVACPCYSAGVQVVGCPCRGQIGCGCI